MLLSAPRRELESAEAEPESSVTRASRDTRPKSRKLSEGKSSPCGGANGEVGGGAGIWLRPGAPGGRGGGTEGGFGVVDAWRVSGASGCWEGDVDERARVIAAASRSRGDSVTRRCLGCDLYDWSSSGSMSRNEGFLRMDLFRASSFEAGGVRDTGDTAGLTISVEAVVAFESGRGVLERSAFALFICRRPLSDRIDIAARDGRRPVSARPPGIAPAAAADSARRDPPRARPALCDC